MWRELANHCEENEPRTLGYTYSKDSDDPTHVLVYERFVNHAARKEVHQQSPAFRRLTDAMSTAQLRPLSRTTVEWDEGGGGFL